MIRPYNLYVQFLITKGYSELDDINNILAEVALPKIKSEEVDTLFEKIHDTLPKEVSNQIESKRYTDSFWRWMKVLGVYDLWRLEKPLKRPEDAHLHLVYDINYDPTVRLMLRALLVKKCKFEDICQDMNFKFSYMIRPEHVELYSKYFWDQSRMTRGAWKKYLPCCDHAERELMFLCLTEDYETVRAHLKLPSRIDIVSHYTRLFVQCNQKVEHYMRLSSTDANRESRAWIQTTMELGDKIKKYEAGNVEDFGKTLQMEFEFVESDFQTPDENVLKEVKSTLDKAKETK